MRLFINEKEILEIFHECNGSLFGVRALEFAQKLTEFINKVEVE